MNEMTGWSAARDGYLFGGVFDTRRELMQHTCWNFGEVEVPETRSLCPWTYSDADEVSTAWRRLKKRFGVRAVRVVVRAAEDIPDA